MGGRGGGSNANKPVTNRFSAITGEAHFVKHGSQYGAKTLQEYESLAVSVRDSKAADGVHYFVSSGGIRYKYNEKTNDFLMYKESGELITFFKPKNGITYWKAQVAKYGSSS